MAGGSDARHEGRWMVVWDLAPRKSSSSNEHFSLASSPIGSVLCLTRATAAHPSSTQPKHRRILTVALPEKLALGKITFLTV